MSLPKLTLPKMGEKLVINRWSHKPDDDQLILPKFVPQPAQTPGKCGCEAIQEIIINPATGGTPYSFDLASALSARGIALTTYVVETGSLPSGLVLNAATGMITGTATAGEVKHFTLKVQ